MAFSLALEKQKNEKKNFSVREFFFLNKNAYQHCVARYLKLRR